MDAGFFETSETVRGRVPGARMAGAGFVRGLMTIIGRACAVSATLPTRPQELERS